MKLRRHLDIILLAAILSIVLVHVSHAQTPPAPPPPTWEFGKHVQLLVGIAALLVAGAVIPLFLAARKPSDSFIFKMRPSFFFWLGMTYTMLLLLVAIVYNVAYVNSKPFLLGNTLPIAVPWFGALGAVTISLEGVFKWSESRWNPEYNYWHVGRPLFGAVLGTIAFFLFVLIVSSSGTPPKFLEDPNAAAPAKDFIIYYVVAFLAGYREETFRELIQRVTDMILKPAPDGAATPQVSFKVGGVAQSEIRFPETAAGASTPSMTIEIVNAGSVPLSKPMLKVEGTDAASKDVFGLAKDQVSGVNELGPNQTATVDITFTPPAPGQYT